MQERILTYVNIILLGLCGWFIWWLTNDNFYSKPAEVARMEAVLELGTDTTYDPPITNTGTGYDPGRTPPPTQTPRPPRSAEPPYRAKTILKELYTPTPTPTPPPTPTPAPPLLKDMLYAWRLVSLIDDKTAEIYDDRTKETFRMTAGGPAKIVTDPKKNDEYPVVIESIDVNSLTVVLKFGIKQPGYSEQSVELKF